MHTFAAHYDQISPLKSPPLPLNVNPDDLLTVSQKRSKMPHTKRLFRSASHQQRRLFDLLKTAAEGLFGSRLDFGHQNLEKKDPIRDG